MKAKGRGVLGIGICAAILAAAAAPASAHEDPPGCTASGLNFSFTPDSGLGIIHRNGDHLELAVRVRNDAAGACSVDDATVSVRLPQPDGTPGPPIVLATGQSFPGGMAQTTLPGTVPHDVDYNSSVFSALVTVVISGTSHFPGGDTTGLIGSSSTPLVVSKPHITLDVTPSAPSGPAPFAVTYTYTALNDTPVDPAQPLSTPDLIAPADRSVLTDDRCSPVTYVSGDVTDPMSSPPSLQEGETWTFTCSRLFDLPGSFTNTVGVVGNSNRDGRPWPATSAQSTITALGPDMTVSKAHDGDFVAGGSGSYTLTATNSGNEATSGAVTLTDSLPAGLTATAIAGPGWDCVLATLSCTRADPLGGGASYPPVTLAVDVSPEAPEQLTNTAAVAGGGETATQNNSASDLTEIKPSNVFTLGKAKSKRDGSVVLSVDVPGPGSLSADDPPPAKRSGVAARAKRPKNLVKRASATASARGPVALRLRPARAAKKLIAERRRLKAKLVVVYEPSGGSAASQPTRVKFKAPR